MSRYHFVIRNTFGDYWNNEIGWVEERSQADHFDDYNQSLPMEGRWVNVPDREAFKYALLEIKEDFDSGDPWGWAIGWLFALCGHVTLHRLVEVPAHVKYEPGGLGPDEGDNRYMINIMHSLTDRQLIYCIERLFRYLQCLDRKGYSY